MLLVLVWAILESSFCHETETKYFVLSHLYNETYDVDQLEANCSPLCFLNGFLKTSMFYRKDLFTEKKKIKPFLISKADALWSSVEKMVEVSSMIVKPLSCRIYIYIYIYIYMCVCVCVCSCGVLVIGNAHSNLSSMEKAVYISHSVNILGKNMNPITLLQLWVNSRAYWAF